MGLAMFLSCFSPPSSKSKSTLPYASSCTRFETQIPPGFASPSRRTTKLTPSPKMSSSSNDFPNIDPDTKLDTFVLRTVGVTLNHLALDFHRASHGVHNAYELHQRSIARRLNNPSVMFFYRGVD